MTKTFAESILWAQNTLEENGYKLIKYPVIARSVPWSTVISFQTTKDFVHLKCMVKDFTHEAILLQFFNEQKFPDLPNLIAINEKDGSFLMQDAGAPLRPYLTKNYDTALICQALKAYTKLQIACIPYSNSLLAKGAIDLRLINLPTIYKEFLLQKELLTFDGLTIDEISLLQNLGDVFENLCQVLASFGIPETLEHGDLHDNNILVKEKKITISDFGDAAISHPFFSIALLLTSSKKHYNFHDLDKKYAILRDCYLQEWETHLGRSQKTNVLQAFKIALLLHPFIFGLNLSRVESCTNEEGFQELHGQIAEQLRILINNLISYKTELRLPAF